MPQQPKNNMAVAEYIGHNHNGKPIYKYDDKRKVYTNEILDDTEEIIKELKSKNLGSLINHKYTFEVDSSLIKKLGILVLRYYWNSKKVEIQEKTKKYRFNFITEVNR